MIVTVIGNGFVGKATNLLHNDNVIVWFYDIVPELCNPINLTFETINEKSDIVFICVPTPMNVDGSCNTKIVESVLKKLKHPCVVLRSTVPIGFADSHNCFFMPEFLTEKNWPQDFYHCPLWVFGTPQYHPNLSDFYSKIQYLMDSAHNFEKIKSKEILFCTNKEAEMIKLVRNNFLSTKVVFFNHIWDLCQKLKIDYNNVIQGVGGDERIGFSHTSVDGIQFRGYGGTCFPKDTNSLFHILQENDIVSPLIEGNLYANEYFFCPDKKWLSMYNRAITELNGTIVLYVGAHSELSTMMQVDLQSGNYVIAIDECDACGINHSNYYFKKTNLTQKIFIPKCDKVICYIPESRPLLESMEIWIQVRKFCSTYQLPLLLILDNNTSQQFWIQSCKDDKLVTIQFH